MDVPYGTVLATIAADLCKEVCDISSDKWHHADESDYLKVSEGRDGTYAVRAKCKYCHKEFIATGLTADSLSTAYSDYVNTLPAQGYDSAGTLLWQPNWSDIIFPSTLSSIASMNGSIVTISSSGFNFTDRTYPSSSPTAQCTAGVSGTVIGISYSAIDHFNPDPRIPSTTLSVTPFSAKFAVPIAGSYTLVQSTFVSAKYEVGVNSNFHDYISWSWWSSGTSTNCGVGGIVSSRAVAIDASGSTVYRCDVGGYRKHVSIVSPIWRVTPIEASVTNNYYISTRVNNFNGDYYDSVTNNYYNNTTIINETTNNYYDMTTNNNYTMSNWSYDYASRTYFITLEDGTTVTVQFGDDCMTITKNDVTNSYQYVIKNNSTPDTPTTCKHDWQETIDTAPTCLEGGHASYTCSKCGETYEQILAAKGHDWKVIEHVNMVYNSDGTVATQGHTLYQCSVCGEQWYTDTGAPPPDVSGSSNILAWLQSFQTWLEEKLDLTPVLERLDAILAQLQDTSGSATCDHTYQQHMEQEADCTLPGLQISICSQCGDSYSEIIDPLGHDWVVTSHVDAVTDPETGQETASAYDVYTCSRCGKTYEDHTGDGAPDEDYGDTSISQLVVKVFSKLGTFAGKLIGFIVRLFDKAISSVDEVISKFNEYTEQISGFGGDYPAWLSGFWAVLPSELQIALTFAVVCMVLGIVGKKLFFS